MSTYNKSKDVHARIIQDYQRQNRSLKQKIAVWKAEHVNRNVALFVGIVAGAMLTNVVWIIGYTFFVLGAGA